MNHSDTEPDSDSDEESYVDCEGATETCYEVEDDMTHFFTVRNTILIYVSFVKFGL
jgi:hypothetical protein